MIMKLGAWLAFSDNWNGNPLRKGERIIDSYCYTKVWKVMPRYLLMTLFPRLGVAGISTPWPFRYPQPVKMSICIAFRFRFGKRLRSDEWDKKKPECVLPSRAGTGSKYYITIFFEHNTRWLCLWSLTWLSCLTPKCVLCLWQSGCPPNYVLRKTRTHVLSCRQSPSSLSHRMSAFSWQDIRTTGESLCQA